jgi:hypothetical protein
MIGAVLLLLLLAPGALAARRWFPERRLLAGAAFTQMLAYLLPLTLHLLGVPLRPPLLALALLPVNLIILAFARPWASPPSQAAPGRRWSLGERWIWALIGLVSFIFVARTTLMPLQGFDVDTRWGLVADVIVADGSLEAYPPVEAEDFTKLFWVEGIPPLVMLDYAWCDWVFGLSHPRLRNLLVIAQWLLILHAGYVLGGPRTRSGLTAVLALCLTPRLSWSVSIGQEAGWLTLGALGLFAAWRWELGEEEDGLRRGLLAGSFAAMGWLSREYGGALWALGLMEAWRLGRGRRELVVFTLVALGVPGTWYLRNALLTGHPFYDLPVFGLFEVHPMNQDMYRSCWCITKPELLELMSLSGLVVLSGWVALPLFVGLPWGLSRWREHGPMVLGALGFTALFLISLPMTCGGLAFATRVAIPGATLLAVVAGEALTRPLRSKLLGISRSLAITVLALWALYSASQLPLWPGRVPLSAAEFATMSRAERLFERRSLSVESGRALARAMQGGRFVLVRGNYWFADLRRAGLRCKATSSVDLRFLHTAHNDPAAAVAKLESMEGLGAVLIPAAWLPELDKPENEPRSSLDRVYRVIRERWTIVAEQPDGVVIVVPPR